MTGDKKAPPDDDAMDESFVGSLNEGESLDDILSDSDLFLDEAMIRDPMPDARDEIAARDPFSADYMEFLKDKAARNRVDPRRVDSELRANLLEKPYLTERPEEAGLRGAAAVWRSLRDQIREESLNLMDASGREELLLLQRELSARKAIVATVDKGLDILLNRLEQRLSALSSDNRSTIVGDEED